MTDAVTAPSRSDATIRFLIAWSALGTMLAVLVPLSTPILLGGSMLMPLLLADRAELGKQFWKIGPATVLMLVICLYVAVNASWSPASRNAAMAVGMVVLATLAAHVGSVAFPLMRAEQVDALRRGLVIGLLVGLAILAFEYLTRMSGQRAFESLLHALGVRGVRIETGTWLHPRNQGMTRSLGFVVPIVWIGLAACLRIERADSKSAGALMFGLAAVSVLVSPSATAKIGLTAGAIAALGALWFPRLTLAGLTAAWVFLCAAIVPVAHLLYRLKLYDAAWIHETGRHRIAIWGATSDWYWSAPIFGAGIASAREQPALDAAHADSLRNLGQTAKLNWHAHNGYLQVWYEAGAVGGLLFMLLGLVLLHAVRRSDTAIKPLLIGAFASFTFFIATGFSIWAAWYIGALGMVIVSAQLTGAEMPAGAAKPR